MFLDFVQGNLASICILLKVKLDSAEIDLLVNESSGHQVRGSSFDSSQITGFLDVRVHLLVRNVEAHLLLLDEAHDAVVVVSQELDVRVDVCPLGKCLLDYLEIDLAEVLAILQVRDTERGHEQIEHGLLDRLELWQQVGEVVKQEVVHLLSQLDHQGLLVEGHDRKGCFCLANEHLVDVGLDFGRVDKDASQVITILCDLVSELRVDVLELKLLEVVLEELVL